MFVANLKYQIRVYNELVNHFWHLRKNEMCLRDTFSNMKCRNECINLLLLLMYVPDIQKISSIKIFNPHNFFIISEYFYSTLLYLVTNLAPSVKSKIRFCTLRHHSIAFSWDFLKNLLHRVIYILRVRNLVSREFFKDGRSKV